MDTLPFSIIVSAELWELSEGDREREREKEREEERTGERKRERGMKEGRDGGREGENYFSLGRPSNQNYWWVLGGCVSI